MGVSGGQVGFGGVISAIYHTNAGTTIWAAIMSRISLLLAITVTSLLFDAEFHAQLIAR